MKKAGVAYVEVKLMILEEIGPLWWVVRLGVQHHLLRGWARHEYNSAIVINKDCELHRRDVGVIRGQ